VAGTDASGNPIYEKNDIRISGANAQAYFSGLSDISESLIFDNSYIKLREIALSYPVLAKPNLGVTLNLFARNIMLWSELDNLDPEPLRVITT
jgi:hypothetical protein